MCVCVCVCKGVLCIFSATAPCQHSRKGETPALNPVHAFPWTLPDGCLANGNIRGCAGQEGGHQSRGCRVAFTSPVTVHTWDTFDIMLGHTGLQSSHPEVATVKFEIMSEDLEALLSSIVSLFFFLCLSLSVPRGLSLSSPSRRQAFLFCCFTRSVFGILYTHTHSRLRSGLCTKACTMDILKTLRS